MGKNNVSTKNFDQAVKDMNLTPQEQYLYQTHLHNLITAPVIHPNGAISTLYQIDFSAGGKTYNVPTVWDGKIHTPQEAMQHASDIGLDKFPSYPNSKAAEARYMQMHSYMEKDVTDFNAPDPASIIYPNQGQ